MEPLVTQLSKQYPIIMSCLSALGTIVVIAQIIVTLTPSKRDDELMDDLKNGVWGKTIEFVKKFAVIQHK